MKAENLTVFTNNTGSVNIDTVQYALAETVINLLNQKGYSISTAESCTGGLIAASLVDVAGCSAVFNEGFITYSNDAKTKRLGVSPELLEKHGAVSPQVAAAMAEGAAQAAGASIGLSITGIAGPDGGTAEKPVGLAYIGLAIQGEETRVERHISTGNRRQMRVQSVKLALDMARRGLE